MKKEISLIEVYGGNQRRGTEIVGEIRGGSGGENWG